MDREKAIETIEFLYPVDSEYQRTGKKGFELLLKAISLQWRSLPTEILVKYAQLCIEEEGGY